MKNSFLLIILFIISSVVFTQDSEIIETELKVSGNCNQCKDRIEKSVKINEVKYAKWNKSTKMLKIAYVSSITADSLQKRIAMVGHETEIFKANAEAYSNLPNCCLYRDKTKTH